MEDVIGLLLAAGGGRRMGNRPKALLPYRGRPMIEHALTVLRAGGCPRVRVVLGAAADEILGVARLGDAEVVRNPEWETGMGSSLRVGLTGLTANAALVGLVDTPGVTPEAVSRVLASGAPLAAASYAGERGHPVLIASRYFAEARAAAVGDAGARALLRAHAGELHLVECGDVASPEDVDTPEQLHCLQGRGELRENPPEEDGPVHSGSH